MGEKKKSESSGNFAVTLEPTTLRASTKEEEEKEEEEEEIKVTMPKH